MKDFMRSSWEVVKTIAIAAAAVLLIRAFLFQPFLVSGASMEPTVSHNNYLIIDELTYRFRDPERGEMVVFRYPNDPKTFYIKRIIGLPGDILQMEKGSVKVNGAALDESDYLKDAQTFGTARVKLDQNDYFVLGDNRNNSYDSRSWGPLGKKLIVGRVLLRLFPFTQISIFNEPLYVGS